MRRTFRITFVLVAMLALVIEAACSDDGALRDVATASDGGAVQTPVGDGGSELPTSMSMSTLRFAHLAPGIGPIDFCYQGAKKGTYVGPVLGGAAAPKQDAGDAEALDAVDASPLEDASDGAAGNIPSASYGTVSKYLSLQAAGPITVSVVEAGATSCSHALATADVTLDPGKLSTVALFGRRADGGIALEIVAFTDDRSTEPDKIRVRVIHAALGKPDVPTASAIAVRAVASKTTVLADRVEPRRTSSTSQAVSVDGLGYVTAPPVPPPASIAIGPASTDAGADAGFDPWQSQNVDLELHGGSLHTAFVLTGASPSTFEVLWCADTTTSGDQTMCKLVR